MNLLDFLFPKRCINCKKIGEYLCPSCFSYISFNENSICLVCNRPSFDGKTHPGCKNKYSIDGSFSALEYKKTVKKLIYQFKYKPYLSDLKSVLVDLFYESLIQDYNFYNIYNHKKNYTVLTPIPLHPSRLKERGYNHAEILAKELGKRFNLSVLNLLQRTRKTKSQFGLKRDERKENLTDAFSMVPNILISQYLNIFLVDDILTTGSTLLEAAKVLKKNGAKEVWGITLARD